MVSLDDVAGWVSELADTTEADRRGSRTWSVGGKVFAWERAFSKADIRRYGDAPVPSDPILAVRVADLGEKAALLAENHRGFFTIEHFDRYAAVLVHLERAAAGPVRDLLLDGWQAVSAR